MLRSCWSWVFRSQVAYSTIRPCSITSDGDGFHFHPNEYAISLCDDIAGGISEPGVAFVVLRK